MGEAENRAMYVRHDLDEPVLLDEAIAVGQGISDGAWWCPGYFHGETHGPHVEDAAERTVAIVGEGPEAEANARLIIAAPRLQRQVVALYRELEETRSRLRDLEERSRKPEARPKTAAQRARGEPCAGCERVCGHECTCDCHWEDTNLT